LKLSETIIASLFLLISAVSVAQSMPNSTLEPVTSSPHHFSHQVNIADTAEVPDEHVRESSERGFRRAQ
jgi:hypothetical protein